MVGGTNSGPGRFPWPYYMAVCAKKSNCIIKSTYKYLIFDISKTKIE